MGEMMTFPASVEEFMEQYKMTDTEHVYSNGTEYVPIYRMKQWFGHINYNGGSDVRHGRWEQCFEDWRQQIEGDKCSVCGFEHYGASTKKYKYCPNCGTKMDLEG